MLLQCIITTWRSHKNTNHQQMHKESFIINRNTLLHVTIDDKTICAFVVISVFV
jgi:hypothetical protein